MNALIAVWLKDDFFAFYVLPPALLVIILFVVWAVCKILHQIYGYRIVVPNVPALEEKFWKGNPEEKVVRPPTAEETRQANMRNAWKAAYAQEEAKRLAKENARREKESKEADVGTARGAVGVDLPPYLAARCDIPALLFRTEIFAQQLKRPP
jgi:hypothetical protein